MRSKNLVAVVIAFIMASSMHACARNTGNVASSSVDRAANGDFMTKSVGGQNKQAQSNINATNEEMGALSVSSRAANNVNATNGGFLTKSVGGQNKQVQSNINAANEEMGSLSVSSPVANNVNATNGGFLTKSVGGQNKQVQSYAAYEEMWNQVPCQIMTPIIFTAFNQKMRGYILEHNNSLLEDNHCWSLGEPELTNTEQSNIIIINQ